MMAPQLSMIGSVKHTRQPSDDDRSLGRRYVLPLFDSREPLPLLYLERVCCRSERAGGGGVAEFSKSSGTYVRKFHAYDTHHMV